MKPTNKLTQFIDQLREELQDGEKAVKLTDRLLGLIDERLEFKLAKPPIPEPGRPTTDSQERELNREREAAETSSPDLGKDDPITPAGPLREMPEQGQFDFYYAIRSGGGVSIISSAMIWTDKFREEIVNAYEAGRLFEFTESGRLGAERRAEQGILPPIDREELRNSLNQLLADLKNVQPNSQYEMWECVQRHHLVLQSILEGGNQNE